ncbi:uncharacterized protein BXZ73DRAFT_107470 [Epithele typhae]|uniref:uncharacterized protein n=1 Tax=Epithele typhae TaxID=378194 RepID=UPI0020082B2D|nr:uncharacterized protein BXZ73DRAFT_107470 [Epithele typhae]KAH9912333.1 hypothetical protein BXZ73DRAFT_107470 [Epithele typhae]
MADASPSLHDLLLLSVSVRDQTEKPEAVSVAHLPRLQKLVCGGQWPAVASLISHLHAPILSDVRLPTPDPEAPGDTLPDFHANLRALKASSSTLRTLHLALPSEWPPLGPGRRPLADILQPLFFLPLLEEFKLLYPETSFSPTDDDFAALARAWPALRRLHIAPPYFKAPVAAGDASFASLLHLARHCPHLETVLLFDALANFHGAALCTDLPPPAVRMRSPRLRGAGEDLAVRPEAPAIATLLERVFPNLQLSESYFWVQNPEECQSSTTWTAVIQVISERRDEDVFRNLYDAELDNDSFLSYWIF